MKLLLGLLALSLVGVASQAHAEGGTFVDEVTFIQYIDENTAFEEVSNGNLDVYYYTIPSDRIKGAESSGDVQVFESTGGSYSVLLNPATGDRFNPFQLQQVRLAVHYLVDRELIANELMGGFGVPKISTYGPHDPDYLHIIETLESFNFRYNPTLANQMISQALGEYGAEMINDVWHYDGEPVKITMLIRSDDPVRKSIGEILAGELESAGFVVERSFGDLNKAFVVVYGSNPADLEWQVYTEGWGSSAFIRYDATGLGQMYSPWFSNMPGSNDPTYWNYENDYLDELTKKIYTSNFTNAEERAQLIRDATDEGIRESVRIFLASRIEQYVANAETEGVINDFGAGVTTRLTPINARTDSGSLMVGVKQIYQGAWNPVVGFGDVYSRDIWVTLFDPALMRHPFNGEVIPVRSSWSVETAGPSGALDVPDDAILWNPASQSWETVPAGTQATSVGTYDLTFSRWHHGQDMDMNDILHTLYFVMEWGSTQEGDDVTFDSEFSPRSAQYVSTLKGIKILDEDTIQVYVDYWHFDHGEIADWASAWSATPWEVYAAMEQAVIDGKTAFSHTGSTSKNVSWLSLLIPNDAEIILGYLEEFRDSGHIPAALEGRAGSEYATARYDSAIEWIQETEHAVISNGPFYLDGYSPESRLIKVLAFDDDSYPFEPGYWSEFEDVKLPTILSVGIPDTIQIGEAATIQISTEDASMIHYFMLNAGGEQILAGNSAIDGDGFDLVIDDETSSALLPGASEIKLFVVSDEVLRPDIYTARFLALEGGDVPLDIEAEDTVEISTDGSEYVYALAAVAAVAVGVGIYFGVVRRRATAKQ